jgi:hypothetical protein
MLVLLRARVLKEVARRGCLAQCMTHEMLLLVHVRGLHVQTGLTGIGLPGGQVPSAGSSLCSTSSACLCLQPSCCTAFEAHV